MRLRFCCRCSEIYIYIDDVVVGLCDDGCRKVEGSRATARLTAELLRSVISQSKLPATNQPAALIDAVRDVGGKLIAANPIGRSFLISVLLLEILISTRRRG